LTHVNVREHLLALNDELRRLKAEGWRSVPVTEESLADLRRSVGAAVAAEPPAAAPVAAEPVRVEVPRAPARAVTVPAGLAPVPAEPPVVVLPEGDKRTRWHALRELVLNHPVCRAHVRPGKQVVLGVGSLDAKIFFCGEAPGAEEEVQGEPFVGPAGQLLTRMIQAMGLQRGDVYIGNIMNWRPEIGTAGGEQYGNRPPTPQELNFCLPFLKAQLAIVQPQLIVALGATAAGGLLGQGTFKALGEIRGRWHTFSNVPLMVTYHPSYILRNQSNRSKRMIWEDLLKVMERAGLPISEKQRKHFLG
jgi:uracil-DNA glycosylase family 4